jgi:hypothetical protein
MTKNPQLRRILVALLISLALNGVLLISGPLMERHPALALARLLDLLGRPAAAFPEWLVPAGHDAVHILGSIAVSALSSVVFYGALAWVMLTTWARAHRKGSNQSGSLSIPR